MRSILLQRGENQGSKPMANHNLFWFECGHTAHFGWTSSISKSIMQARVKAYERNPLCHTAWNSETAGRDCTQGSKPMSATPSVLQLHIVWQVVSHVSKGQSLCAQPPLQYNYECMYIRLSWGMSICSLHDIRLRSSDPFHQSFRSVQNAPRRVQGTCPRNLASHTSHHS